MRFALVVTIFLLVIFSRPSLTFEHEVEPIPSFEGDTIYVNYKISKAEASWWTFKITAYTPSPDETDDTPLIGAWGDSVITGMVAADPRVLPRGTKLIIPGYNGDRPCTVLDTGSKIKGASIDVFVWTKKEALEWGIKRRKIKILK